MTVTEAGIVMSNEDRNWLEQRLDGFENKMDTRLTRFEDKIEGKIDKLPCVEHKEELAKLAQKVDNGIAFRNMRRQERSLSIKWIIALIAGCQLVSTIVTIIMSR